MTKFYLRITASKLLAYLIALCSGIYGISSKDGANMMVGFGIAAGLFANKQYQDRKEVLNNKKESNE
jgi:hypothetical protein